MKPLFYFSSPDGNNYYKMTVKLEEIQKNYPFLSVIKVANEERVGIIQNCDQRIISIYCYDYIQKGIQPLFLEYGRDWWWESNRKLPVNMFIGEKFQVFSNSLRSYSMKETEVVFGPITKLSDLLNVKRLRRKTVQLIRKV